MISKKRNRMKAAASGATPAGAAKFAIMNPAISSMTIFEASFSPKIASARSAAQIPRAVKAASVRPAKIRESAARRLSASESGIATTVPAVPGAPGIYPAPAPVARNKIKRRRLGQRRRGELRQEQPLPRLEDSQQGRLNDRFGRRIEIQRVDVLVVLIDLEVEVRAGAQARGADEADNLAFEHLDAVAEPVRESLQMGVARGVAAVVRHLDQSSVAAFLPAGEGDSAVGDRAHGRTELRGEIDAVMRPVDA